MIDGRCHKLVGRLPLSKAATTLLLSVEFHHACGPKEQVLLEWLTAALQNEGIPDNPATQDQRIQYAMHYVNVLSSWELSPIEAQTALYQLKVFHRSIKSGSGNHVGQKQVSTILEATDHSIISAGIPQARARVETITLSAFADECSPEYLSVNPKGAQKRKRGMKVANEWTSPGSHTGSTPSHHRAEPVSSNVLQCHDDTSPEFAVEGTFLLCVSLRSECALSSSDMKPPKRII